MLSKKSNSSKEEPTVKVKEPNIEEAILDVHLIKVSTNEYTIIITNIDKYPEAKLECALNKTKLKDCKNGLILDIDPNVTSHSLTVIAKNNDDQILAVGETRVNLKQNISDNFNLFLYPDTESYNQTLALQLDDSIKFNNQRFYNGIGIPIDSDLLFKFKFIQNPDCQNIEVRCASGLKESKFKPLCDSDITKYYPKGTIAKGIQFLTVQAFCKDNNSYGPPLVLYWYGVPFNYKFMKLEYISNVDNSEYIFSLMKANDCPINLLEFECRYTYNSTFVKCNNYIKNPKAGFAIRAVCNGKAYEALEL